MTVRERARPWPSLAKRACFALALTMATSMTPARAAAQVSRVRDLSFGTVITGTTTSIAVTSSGAAMWQIHVSLLSTLGSFTLSLPTTLTRNGGGGSMPLTFCSTCARYRVNNSSVSGATTFNPSTTVTFSLLGLGSDVYVWLGGAVNPPLNQPGGTYSGTMVITTTGLII